MTGRVQVDVGSAGSQTSWFAIQERLGDRVHHLVKAMLGFLKRAMARRSIVPNRDEETIIIACGTLATRFKNSPFVP